MAKKLTSLSAARRHTVNYKGTEHSLDGLFVGSTFSVPLVNTH
jgi:hypothetical protein